MDRHRKLWHEIGVVDTRARPRLARADRGGMAAAYQLLLRHPRVFVDGVTALDLVERRLLATLLRRDAQKEWGLLPRIGRIARRWARVEADVEVRLTLRHIQSDGCHALYQEGPVVWLVRPCGAALELREGCVRYHHRIPRRHSQPRRAAADIRDEAARRIWANRRRLPAAARAFAPFFA